MTRLPQLTTATVATDPTVCLCPGGQGVPIGTFRDQQLVRLERRHLLSTGCGRGSEYVDPRAYQAGIRTRSARTHRR